MPYFNFFFFENLRVAEVFYKFLYWHIILNLVKKNSVWEIGLFHVLKNSRTDKTTPKLALNRINPMPQCWSLTNINTSRTFGGSHKLTLLRIIDHNIVSNWWIDIFVGIAYIVECVLGMEGFFGYFEFVLAGSVVVFVERWVQV